jgi:hypothetical protein
LERFVNLGDSLEDFQTFAKQWPTFCPVLLYHERTGHTLNLLLDAPSRELSLVFRDYLRLVWLRNDWALENGVLEILLGLRRNPISANPTQADEDVPQTVGTLPWNDVLERRSRSMFPDTAPRFRRALMLLRLSPRSKFHQPRFPLMMADWDQGEFRYQTCNDFQRAVLLLFRKSWRARTCRWCRKPFIAENNPQQHCSIACSSEAQKDRDLKLWRERGAHRRRQRRKAGKRRGS